MTAEEKREYNRKWREAHPGYFKKKNKEWRDNHSEHIAVYNKKYKEEHRQEQKEYEFNRYWSNPEYHKQRKRNYYKSNTKKTLTTNQKYAHSKEGRATKLCLNYVRNDTNAGREACTLTREWIVDHIFSSSCVYCGDSDWKHLGCDRIDNSLPHTPENCVCSCGICNIDRQVHGMSVEDFKKWRSENPRECDIKKVG